MPTWLKSFIELMFGLGLFFNSLLFIVQAWKLFKAKESKDISLVTFAGFNIMQVFTILHGYLNKDYVLMVGFLLSFVFCGAVTFLIVLYRR
ncbi:PQ loop repeat [Gammaproteobacteria bacterium]